MPEDKKRVVIPAVENLAGKEMADAWNKELYGVPLSQTPGPRACRQTRGRLYQQRLPSGHVIFIDDMEEGPRA